jgi:homogentisate 1,2-dioxygenase
MPPYKQIGSIPPKRHTAHRAKPGFRGEGIYYEEVVTTTGFGRAYSIVYHLRPPTRVRKVEPAGTLAPEVIPQQALRHFHVRSGKMPRGGDPVRGRVPIFVNQDVIMSRCRPERGQEELYRNAAADEILFIHRGSGILESMFGVLPFRPFDYVVIPRTTTYRLEFDDAAPPDLLVIESTGNVGLPPRYLNPDGQIRLGAPYSERDFHGPRDPLVTDKEGDTTLLVKDGTRLTRYTMAHHPFDVVGWDGMVYPHTFNADDFEPITGTVHQPPPVHQTFETPGFVVCTFAPRMLDTHPSAIKVPYAHSNVDSDEVLYYVRGKFGSRKGVEEASFTLHPRGVPHGPHPGTIVASKDATLTDELAVMVDTFRPLNVTRQALEMEDAGYPLSWME